MFQEQPTTILHSRISYEQLLQVHFSTRATAESGGILQSLYCNRGITRVGEKDCTETTVDYIQFSEVFSRI